jgi:dTDP-4-amino-4,6-dideoxygalactose transaminase
MDAVIDIARRHDLYVIEDACQAWGASWRGRPVGAIGDLGCFSFQASKNINAGEGGAIVTNDPELAERCWSLHNVGRIRDGAWYQHEFLGWNYRMTEWQGAILLAQLERLPGHIKLRADNAAYLSVRLGQIDGLTPARVDERVTQHAWHLFMATYDPQAFGGRPCSEFIAMMRAEGIPCAPGYVPLNRTPAILRSLAEQEGKIRPWESRDVELPVLPACPVAEDLCQRTVWFGQNLLLGDHEDMDDSVASVFKIQQEVGVDYDQAHR